MGSRSKHTRRYKRGDHWVPRGPQQRGGLPQATRDERAALRTFKAWRVRWLNEAVRKGVLVPPSTAHEPWALSQDEREVLYVAAVRGVLSKQRYIEPAPRFKQPFKKRALRRKRLW